MTTSLAARAAKVRLLVLDVDGVLTDGILVYGPAGEEVKRLLQAAEWLDRRGGELLGRDRSASRPAG